MPESTRAKDDPYENTLTLWRNQIEDFGLQTMVARYQPNIGTPSSDALWVVDDDNNKLMPHPIVCLKGGVWVLQDLQPIDRHLGPLLAGEDITRHAAFLTPWLDFVVKLYGDGAMAPDPYKDTLTLWREQLLSQRLFTSIRTESWGDALWYSGEYPKAAPDEPVVYSTPNGWVVSSGTRRDYAPVIVQPGANILEIALAQGWLVWANPSQRGDKYIPLRAWAQQLKDAGIHTELRASPPCTKTHIEGSLSLWALGMNATHPMVYLSNGEVHSGWVLAENMAPHITVQLKDGCNVVRIARIQGWTPSEPHKTSASEPPTVSTPEELTRFINPHDNVDDPDVPFKDGGKLDIEELEEACRNVGVDLHCAACAEIFYTGSTGGAHSCSTHTGGDTPRWDLLPMGALSAITAVLTSSAARYSSTYWQRTDGWRWRFYRSALHHIFAWWKGERLDSKTGLPHLAHAAVFLIYLIELDTTE